jgi:NADH-quinone oxidoreductase subunit F
MPAVKALTVRWDEPEPWTLATYERTEGYQALRKVLGGISPDDMIQLVKDSGLRGRGGAGFPTGMKWGFIPQGDGKDHYVVVNADEGEPGACKDALLMMNDPHQLIEGTIIASYAIRCSHAFIYLRGELVLAGRRLEQAIADAYAAGYLGKNILGSGFDCDVTLFRGAGAYICGEETALLDSLEGYRGQPRLRPPFPAIHGLYGCPTVVNNVETIGSVPFIVQKGVDWFRSMGTEKSPGPKVFSVSGHVNKPGNYEVPLGITARELIYDIAGGIADGRELKAWFPGGGSTPMFTAAHLDTTLDYEGVAAAGSALGSASVIVMDDTTCIVGAVARLEKFYAHESCGKCTPCREGTYWMVQVLDRLENGQGTEADLKTLLDTCDNIAGRSFCALGDFATGSVVSSITHFRDEYIAHVEQGGCPFRTELVPLGVNA